jgi:small subunit ribosomal protein S16
VRPAKGVNARYATVTPPGESPRWGACAHERARVTLYLTLDAWPRGALSPFTGPVPFTLGPAGHSPLAGAGHTYLTSWEKSAAVAVKIRLKRLGKIREPYYRVVVADSRTKRDGRAIEEIGKYHPKLEPSLIEIDSERAQYWLSVGAQPTEQVQHLLTITGDWQKFKGQPGTEGTLKTGDVKADKKDRYEELVKESLAAKEAKAAAKPARSSAKKDAPKKAEPAAAEAPAAEDTAEAPAAEAPAAEAPAAEAPAVEAPAAEAPAEATEA